MNTGFFTFDEINEVLAIKDFSSAKAKAELIVNEFVATHPKTKSDNIFKAKTMIRNASSMKSLVLAMGNFALAHEGLAVIK